MLTTRLCALLSLWLLASAPAVAQSPASPSGITFGAQFTSATQAAGSPVDASVGGRFTCPVIGPVDIDTRLDYLIRSADNVRLDLGAVFVRSGGASFPQPNKTEAAFQFSAGVAWRVF